MKSNKEKKNRITKKERRERYFQTNRDVKQLRKTFTTEN